MRRFIFIFLLSTSFNNSADESLSLGRFSSGSLNHWEEKAFEGNTQYQIVVDEKLKNKVLQAKSQASASGLFREIKVDLNKTPILNWSWRVKNSLENLDERSKLGDDYAARIYIVVSGGIAFWNTKSLNYVWSSNMPVGSNWPNAYAADNVIMIALQSGNQVSNEWHQEKRNIQADFKRYFGKTVEQLDAIAIMTDTDNSGQKALAWYGDVFFSSE